MLWLAGIQFYDIGKSVYVSVNNYIWIFVINLR